MPDIADLVFEPKTLALSQLILDPNNPRFADSADGDRPTPESHYHNPGIQERVLRKLLNEDFDISELKRSIAQIGFIPVDKIVVRDLGNGYFVVLEGNRRTAALKSIFEDAESGIATEVSADRLRSIENVDVLVLRADDPSVLLTQQWIVQGLRHLSGIKPWGPYQRARAVEALLKRGLSEKQAAQSLGIRISEVGYLLRSLKGLEQMRAIPEFEDDAKPRMFSFFMEIQKTNKLKEWLQWEDERGFVDAERFKEVLSWITEQRDEDGNKVKRVTRAIDLREVATLMDYDAAFTSFRHGRTVEQARVLIPVNPTLFDEWKEAVAKATRVLVELPTNVLESMSEDERNSILELASVIDRRIIQQELIRAQSVASDLPITAEV